MARISGLILGLGFLVVLSSLVSPASAWDDDDDDGYKRRRRPVHVHPGPVIIPPRHVEHYGHGREEYVVPQYPRGHYPAPPVNYPPQRQEPILPAPLPPSAFDEGFDYHSNQYVPTPRRETYIPTPDPRYGVPDYGRPGQFVNAAVPLYPRVRVKDQDEAPRFGIHQILAVKSPDPFNFPGCVYVKVCVPPGPCRDVQVKNGGAYIKLKYPEHEIEIASGRGVITVEYDD